MPAPLIGVTSSELRSAERAHPSAQSEPPRQELALGLAYLHAIESAGGIPVILAPMPAGRIGSLLDRLQGVCLSGGPDLDPGCYGGSPHPELGPTEPPLDRFELEVARRAWARRLPVLAICRGAQLLNVSRGGSLIQHLPERVGDAIEHRQGAPAGTATHAVRLDRSSRLARLLGAARAEVNSLHHQAVDGLGIGLRAVAWAPDGVVEAIESRGPSFAVGVQWHAECLGERPEQQRLFEGFIRAARRSVPLPDEQAA